ncbi:MAG: hypothetical protein ACOC8J_13490 [Ralstonia sp.]
MIAINRLTIKQRVARSDASQRIRAALRRHAERRAEKGAARAVPGVTAVVHPLQLSQ